MMSRVRGSATRPELIVRQAVRSLGVGYRLNCRDLPGTPCLAFIGRRRAIFVHGCFWHPHGYALTGKAPRKRAEYWAPKLKRSVERDAEAARRLEALGYSVPTIWECEVRCIELTKRLQAFLDA